MPVPENPGLGGGLRTSSRSAAAIVQRNSDPGVLEVNLPPASHWMSWNGSILCSTEKPVAIRLTAEKFAYDGSRNATGGGNHIVIGGATLLDSPLLRRPDLLRSMVGFWQNHPSLSYLFSGMYVGPTSHIHAWTKPAWMPCMSSRLLFAISLQASARRSSSMDCSATCSSTPREIPIRGRILRR